MLARIEVAVRPDFLDSAAQGILRRIELASPALRRKIRWARLLDVYWIDISEPREELIPAITQICWDRVLQWVFTGNLIPSAAGKTGGVQDLMQFAPHRPGKFWGIERRFRPGVTDNVGRTLLEAFDIVLGKTLQQTKASSGGLLILEGPDLAEEDLAQIAKNIFCNELIETWMLIPEETLKKNDRFHQERVKYDLPKVLMRGSDHVETIDLVGLNDAELLEMSRNKLWALSLAEMKTISEYFSRPSEKQIRENKGLGSPTDVELEVLAQTWSEHCKHKIFNAQIRYRENGSSGIAPVVAVKIPSKIQSLFKTTISGTTAQIKKSWLLSVFEDNAGIAIFDDEDAFCIKVETHNSPSALDPYGGALTGIVGVNRDILGCGLGARPIFNTDVFCVAVPDYSKPLPDRILHPRRILDGVRRGVEHGGNKSGIPTINGALVFDDRYLGKPLIFCGTGGLMPRSSAGNRCEVKTVLPGDKIGMVGGRIGKDGIHGATFSSLALDEFSPTSAVQLGDPLTQKRMSDFLLEARELGLYRAITDNGAGGLSSSVGEMARLSGGAWMDVSLAKTKYPGLKPFELVVSESQERMTVAIAPEKLNDFLVLADRRSVEVSVLGEFRNSGRFEIVYEGKTIADLDLKFLHDGVPRLEIEAEWQGPGQGLPVIDAASGTLEMAQESFSSLAGQALLGLLSQPNIASKEWLIRQYDHEVQGMSVIKPLNTAYSATSHACSGPNDAGVIQPKSSSSQGLAVGCGINPKLSDVDPYLMAQSAVDEAIRNVLCVGAEYGSAESVLALVDNFCWPDPVSDSSKAASLVRACFGLRDAALELSTPLVSGKDSMKNDFRGKRQGEPVSISIPPTLMMTAVGRVADIKQSRTADFKSIGDWIYLLGPSDFGLLGSELQKVFAELSVDPVRLGSWKVGTAHWDVARSLYRWLGGAKGKLQSKLKSVHDVSDGGMLVALAECLITKGIGATIRFREDKNPWELAFGEGFHCFVVTVAPEEGAAVETEWNACKVPWVRLGQVESQDRLEVFIEGGSRTHPVLSVGIKQIRSAWQKEGYWE